MCSEGCGRRRAGVEFSTCCKSCAYLHRKKGFCGHDVACDIRHNGGTSPPWYWKSAARWPAAFHEEVGGEYVKKMGTKILQRRLPDRMVVKCERIEDSTLWNIYAAKRAQIRRRRVAVVDVKPETSEMLDFSAKTTLDSTVNEVWLLHGTSEEAAKAIAKSNFTCSSGGCFGSGAYFADDSSKSNQYAKGQTDEGCKDPNVDSVLGFTNTREFVVYDMAQIYPEYVLYYREREG